MKRKSAGEYRDEFKFLRYTKVSQDEGSPVYDYVFSGFIFGSMSFGAATLTTEDGRDINLQTFTARIRERHNFDSKDRIEFSRDGSVWEIDTFFYDHIEDVTVCDLRRIAKRA